LRPGCDLAQVDASSGAVVFLLPHQDDEFAVFHLIEETVRRGDRAVCLFMTGGEQFGWQSPERRNAESLKILRRLGVAESDIHFVGTTTGLRDGVLYRKLEPALKAVESVLGCVDDIRSMIVAPSMCRPGRAAIATTTPSI
jgi:LmbE family N-acetylglucosaminyl deacetylase